jgi:hypothetical protein
LQQRKTGAIPSSACSLVKLVQISWLNKTMSGP